VKQRVDVDFPSLIYPHNLFIFSFYHPTTMSNSPSHTVSSTGTLSLSRDSLDTLDESSNNAPKKVFPWTEEEDQRLHAGIEEHGEHNWKAIATVVGTREPSKRTLF
jgi:hypothetical protein